MSASGAKLFDDDLACDVRDLFRELLGRGKTVAKASATLMDNFHDVLGTQEECVFWLALAAVQWEYGMLQPQLLKRALSIVDSGADLERWLDNARLLDERRKVLAFLTERLASPNRKPKRVDRKKRHPLHLEWECGDVIAYQLPSMRFILLRVVAVERNWLQELPTCELLDWNGREIPEPDAIAKLLIRRNKRYPSESTFHFPMLKKHFSRCRSLHLRLPPIMRGDEWAIPLNFSDLPASLEEYFGMSVE